MKKILIFGGTKEGREIGEFVCGKNISAYICTATEYGSSLLPDGENIISSSVRLNEEEMENFMKNEKSATNVYKYAVDNLNKTYKENNSAKITENENNTQSVYDVTASDYHCKVIKKENTVLYVTAYPEYKEDAEKLVKELGY